MLRIQQGMKKQSLPWRKSLSSLWDWPFNYTSAYEMGFKTGNLRVLAKQSERVFNLGWGLLTNFWRKKAGRFAVSRVGGDVPAEGAVSTKSKWQWVQGNCPWFIAARTHRSRALDLRQPSWIFTFQVCVFITNPLFLKGKGFLVFFFLFWDQGSSSVFGFRSELYKWWKSSNTADGCVNCSNFSGM